MLAAVVLEDTDRPPARYFANRPLDRLTPLYLACPTDAYPRAPRRLPMARRRMSDTNAIASASPCTMDRTEYHSKSVRKIDGGFIVSESHSTGDNYESREYFTKNPDRGAPKPQGAVGPENLSGAISEVQK